MRKLPFLLFLAMLLSSCGEFSRALKSTDLEYKVEVAQKYYAIGEKGVAPDASRKDRRRARGGFERSIPLLEELIVLTRGTARSEQMNYMHAKAHFGMKDYIMASYYLANFTRTFPKSQYAEECAFLSAYCHFKNSPGLDLDQAETRHAIDQLQLFMVRYPQTSLKDSSNALIDDLRYKLERKSYHGARQYYRMRNYQAAGVALRNFVREWPNSEFREEAMFLVLRSDHFLAMNSVETKLDERLGEAIKSYHNFADAFPQSKQLSEADRMHKELLTAKEKSNRPNP
jgi:outer membrane protein assembly factor BamD